MFQFNDVIMEEYYPTTNELLPTRVSAKASLLLLNTQP